MGTVLSILALVAFVGMVFIIIRGIMHRSGPHTGHVPNPPSEPLPPPLAHLSSDELRTLGHIPTRTPRGGMPPTAREVLQRRVHPMERTGVRYSDFDMTVDEQTGGPRTPWIYTDPPLRLSSAQEAELDEYQRAYEQRTGHSE